MVDQNFVVLSDVGVPIKAWIRGVELEETARVQLKNVASMPFVFKHVAVMPDVHWGMGATVGSVIATHGAIIPAAVGVDIGCGMVALRTNLTAEDLPDNLAGLRSEIEAAIPVGGPGIKGSWEEAGRGAPPHLVQASWTDFIHDYAEIADKHPACIHKSPCEQLGTLGTGNHFIEICLDGEHNVWIMLHSGSRGLGNRIGSYFIEQAKREMRRWFINLPDDDLAYLPQGSPLFADYVRAVGFAQRYAHRNRQIMLDLVRFALARCTRPIEITDEAINCHHNYISREQHFGEDVWVTRKGAVAAGEGQLGIIPGSMGTRSYIVRGKGNPQSFHSCSHGAGRRMSRGEARRRFTIEDHIAATEGIECRKDADVIDETPAAYKDIDAVMAAQQDLVEVRHVLRQVLCVKG